MPYRYGSVDRKRPRPEDDVEWISREMRDDGISCAAEVLDFYRSNAAKHASDPDPRNRESTARLLAFAENIWNREFRERAARGDSFDLGIDFFRRILSAQNRFGQIRRFRADMHTMTAENLFGSVRSDADRRRVWGEAMRAQESPEYAGDVDQAVADVASGVYAAEVAAEEERLRELRRRKR